MVGSARCFKANSEGYVGSKPLLTSSITYIGVSDAFFVEILLWQSAPSSFVHERENSHHEWYHQKIENSLFHSLYVFVCYLFVYIELNLSVNYWKSVCNIFFIQMCICYCIRVITGVVIWGWKWGSYVVYFAFGVSKYEGNNSNLRCWDWGEVLAVCMNAFQSDVAMYNFLSFKIERVLSLLWRYSRSKSCLYWWRVLQVFTVML